MCVWNIVETGISTALPIAWLPLELSWSLITAFEPTGLFSLPLWKETKNIWGFFFYNFGHFIRAWASSGAKALLELFRFLLFFSVTFLRVYTRSKTHKTFHTHQTWGKCTYFRGFPLEILSYRHQPQSVYSRVCGKKLLEACVFIDGCGHGGTSNFNVLPWHIKSL